MLEQQEQRQQEPGRQSRDASGQIAGSTVWKHLYDR